MKTIFGIMELTGALLVLAAVSPSGQVLPSSGLDDMALATNRPVPAVNLAWNATARDGLSTTWEATEYLTNAATGLVTSKPHRYTEIASGLNYLDSATGQYQPSQDLIELTADGGAAALHGPAKLYLNANLNSAGAITFVTAAGRTLSTRPLGIFWYNAQSGQAEVVAAVRDCVGELVSPNQVVWKSAFGPVADLRVTYTKSGIESDLIFLQQPALPAGWDPRTARLELWHDWTGAPTPAINPRLVYTETDTAVRQKMVEPDQTDQILNFGSGDLWLPTGAAFATDGTASLGVNVAQEVRVPDLTGNPGLTPVAKTWLPTPLMDVLVEAVRWQDVEAKFGGLPPAAPPAVSAQPLDRLGSLAQLPAPNTVPNASQAISVATEDYHPAGVVLDYITVPSSCNSNYTFATGNTYYVNSTTYFSAVVYFNPGCIIKFNGNYLLIYGSIVCNGVGGNPSILTTYHESLFGDLIPGANGACPAASASPALWDYYINANLSISYMRFRWAQTAIRFDANGCGNYSHTVSGCTFEECQTGIYANNCNVAISASTRSDVGTPTAPDPRGGCISFTGALTDVGNVDSDGDYLLDSVDYKYFGRLGTLPGNIAGQVSHWTSGHSPSTDQTIWSTRDTNNGVYVYNTNCWLYGVTGLTAFAPWNSLDIYVHGERGPTLITPRHAVCANHAPITSGVDVRFVGSDNTTYLRTCLASANVSGSDYMVIVLNTNLPSTVGYVRVLPAEVTNKMTPNMQQYPGATTCLSSVVPGVGFNKLKQAYVIDLLRLYLASDPPYFVPKANVQHSLWFPDWGSYCYRTHQDCGCGLGSDVASGDSGSPLCLIINNELVLIGPWWYCVPAVESASWQGDWLSNLNQTIVNLDTQVGYLTGYSATVFPVTNFASSDKFVFGTLFSTPSCSGGGKWFGERCQKASGYSRGTCEQPSEVVQAAGNNSSDHKSRKAKTDFS